MQQAICNILLFIVSVCTLISYVPQIVKLIKTKKSEDIAISSWVIWVTSSTSYLIYSFIISDMMLVISSLLDFIMTLMVLVLTIKYKGRHK